MDGFIPHRERIRRFCAYFFFIVSQSHFERAIYICRAYVLNYLKHHPKIHGRMTLIVRQLQPGAEGLPIEVYAFTNDTDWSAYEGIQADIFDHLQAIAPEFGLRIYQRI